MFRGAPRRNLRSMLPTYLIVNVIESDIREGLTLREWRKRRGGRK